MSFRELLSYFVIGTGFGIVLIKSEVVSWFRIQEMFRFQGVHMYGILVTAALTAGLSIWFLKALKVKALNGEDILIVSSEQGQGKGHRYWIGGIVFGLGWGLAGTCPGPMYALIGAGSGAAAVVLLSALIGTRVYAALADRLPH